MKTESQQLKSAGTREMHNCEYIDSKFILPSGGTVTLKRSHN